MNFDEYLEEDDKRYKASIKKSRRKSARKLFLYIFMIILAIIIIIINGFSIGRLLLVLSFAFCIFISNRNRIILKEEVVFPTEYLENEQKETEESENLFDDGYLDPDYMNEE